MGRRRAAHALPCATTGDRFTARLAEAAAAGSGKADGLVSGSPSWVRLSDQAPESEGIDLTEVRRHRQDGVRAEMAERDIAALIISDPVNIRYSTGARNMQVFTSRNTPSRYVLLTAERCLLFEFTGCEHLADDLETIDEIRASSTASFVAAGDEIAARERSWAAEMADLITELVGDRNVTVGIERMNAGVALALADQGLRLTDAQQPIERARAIKSPGEIACIRASLAMAERAVAAMEEAIRPGLTENELWSILHQRVIAENGDYCETRLLNSGPRTNPWFQESTARVIQPNELIALDTDIVGCHGYYADFSRTFHVGPSKPTAAQRTLYQLAHEQVQHNLSIIKPGMSFADYGRQAWTIPERYHRNRYYLSAHGVGMTGEYPYLYHWADYADAGYDGEIVPDMTLCVESYIGADDGGEGVKLEQQVLVTDTGVEVMSAYPFDDDLL